MNKCLLSLLTLVFTMLFVSCSQSVPPMQKDFADAVTNINQVDPYYRAYFRSQNGSNYTLSDQRAAYFAAMKTARTPVRASEYRAVSETRLASRSTRKAGRGGKASAGRRAVASRSAAKGKKARATARRGAAKNTARRSVARNSSKARSRRRG